VTLVDRCGRVQYGPKSMASFKGFTEVEISPEVEEGEDYSQRDIDGEWCVVGKGEDSVKWWSVKITFCKVDADVFHMMNRAWRLNLNAQGKTSGVRMGQKISNDLGFALELWPKLAEGGGGVCDDEDAPADVDPSGYLLLPWCVSMAPDSWNLANGVATFALNARTRAGSRWGVGPYDVVRQVDGTPGPLLVPIDSGRTGTDPDLVITDVVDVAPPPVMCGAQPLSNPLGPAFTVETVDGQPLQREFTPPATGGPYSLDPGDGSAAVTLPTAGLVHTYAAAGVYAPSVYPTATPGRVTFQLVEVTAT
jgi:hypothetical protein